MAQSNLRKIPLHRFVFRTLRVSIHLRYKNVGIKTPLALAESKSERKKKNEQKKNSKHLIIKEKTCNILSPRENLKP